VALVCGRVSGGLFGQDFEIRKDAEAFYPKLSELAKATPVIVTPHGGIHIWMRTLSPPRRKIRVCEEHPFDILGEGGYLVAPPSVLDGKQYEIIDSPSTIMWIAQDPFPTIVKRGLDLGWKMRALNSPESVAASVPVAITPSRTLTGKQRQEIVEALVPYWQHGRRHELTIYLLGLLIKRGIMKDDAEAILRAICQAADDEELTERLAQVRYHYANRLHLGSKLKGMAGLRELLGVESI
jgi:hypothetical protein